MSRAPKVDDPPREPTWEVVQLFPTQGDWSVGEYLELSEQHNKLIEFTDGRLEILPMPTTSHQLIVVWLYKLLDDYIRAHRLGAALTAPLRVRVRQGKFREPDIVFMATANLNRARDKFWEGADLVMEVVSEGGRERDFETKRADYAEAGVPEYWIVDPQEQQILVLTLRDGAYEEHGVFRRGETATSVLLPGFRVEVSAVFDRTLT